MWKIDFKRGPIYLQIADQIGYKVARGEWLPGDKLPSARVLACQANINPNTVTSAFAELERRKVIEKRRGLGTFIKENTDTNKLKLALLRKINQEYLLQIRDLGVPLPLAIEKLNEETSYDSPVQKC